MKIVIALLIATTMAAGGAACMSMCKSDEAMDLVAQQESILAELREQNADLAARLVDVENRKPERIEWKVDGTTESTVAGAEEPIESSAPDEREVAYANVSDGDSPVDALLANPTVAEAVRGSDHEGAKEVIRSLLTEIEEEEEERERAERMERRKERTRERVARWSERLHLQASQEEELVEIITTGSINRRELWRQAREGGVDRSEVRTLMQQSREETNEQVSLVLTSDQYEEYQKIQEEEQSRDRRRGGWGAPATPNTGNTGNSNGTDSNNTTPRRGGTGS